MKNTSPQLLSHKRDGMITVRLGLFLLELGVQVRLSIPFRSKLQPRWEGGWTVIEVLRQVNFRITHNDGRERVVHMNRVRERYERNTENDILDSNDFFEGTSEDDQSSLIDPNVVNYQLLEESQLPRRSSRIRRRPRYLDDYVLH